jgi:hypothetical protein
MSVNRRETKRTQEFDYIFGYGQFKAKNFNKYIS